MTNIVENMYNELVNALRYAADKCIVKTPVNLYKHWWDDKLDDLRSKCTDAYKLWCNSDKPRSGTTVYLIT